MKLITVLMPAPYLEAIDYLVRKKVHPNRAEAIRMYVREGLREELERVS